MPGRDRIGENSNRQSLDRVLDLFLKLAFEPGNTWRSIEKGIRKKKQAFGLAAKDIEEHVKREIESLKSSLAIELVNVEDLCSGDLRTSIDTAQLDQQAARRSGKAFLLLKRADRGISTKDAIHKCIDYYESAPSAGATHQKTGGLPSEKAQQALRLLQELDLYMPCKGRKEQGSVYRHFALDFSSCQPLSQEKCKEHVEAQLVKKFGQAGPASAQPNTAPKGQNAALLKELDARVAALLPLAEKDFKRRRRADQKHIHVPLKAIIVAPDWEGQDLPPPRQPQPEDLRAIANADGSQLLLIWEEGGAGKTSLAYEMGTWALRGDVADHPLLPFFLDPGGFDLATSCSLSQHVANGLDKLGGPAVTAEQVEQLLRHQRLLLIVDHFSELTAPQRDWVRSRLPSRALVLLTSRLAACKQSFLQDSWRITEIQTQRLKDQELFDFFEQFLMQRGADRRDGRNARIGPDEQIRTRDLLERLVGHKPVTVLLAWMVIEKAIVHIQQRGSGATDGPVDLLPSSVPEMMQDYVTKICENKPSSDPRLSQDPQRKAAVILASLKALSLASHRQNEAFYPQNFDEKLALSALVDIRPDGEVLKDQDKHQLLNYLVNDLTLLTRVEQQFSHATYRVALDPLADYLAALAQQECWQNGAEGKDHHDLVKERLDQLLGRRHRGQKEADLELEAIDGMRGFLAACRDCYLLWLKRQAEVLTPTQQQQWQT